MPGLHIQSLCVRLALSTGWHLARCYREEYDKKVVRALWVVSELRDYRVGRSGSDWNRVGVEVDFWVSYGRRRVLDAAVDACVFGLQHFGVRKLEAFMGSLVAIMSLCYLGELVYCDDVHVGEVIAGASIPRIPSTTALFIACLC